MTVLQSFPPEAEAVVQGASRGIGLEFVRQLVDAGFRRVHAISRAPERSEGLNRLLRAHSDRINPVAADITREADIVEAVAVIREVSPRIHLALNVAGLLHDGAAGMWPEKRLEDLTAEHMERSFRVNAIAPALMARELTPLLAHGERAVLANLSARVGSIGDNRLGGWYSYRASKAAQNMITRGVAVEFARRARSVICVALHPGTTDTDLSAPFQTRVPEGKLFTTAYAVDHLLAVIDGLKAEDSGRFFGWDGAPIPW